MSQNLQQRYASSPLYGGNAAYVEDMYETYLGDPASVPDAWRTYFGGLNRGQESETSHRAVLDDVASRIRRPPLSAASGPLGRPGATAKQAAVSRLIQVYGLRGYQIADLDPLGLQKRHTPAVLKLDYLGITDDDMDAEFYTGGLAGTGSGQLPLHEILEILRKVYCGKVGADFAHLSRARERRWIRERLEKSILREQFSRDERRIILEHVTAADGIERFLHTKYVGQKRFSLEGGESMIPMLDDLIQQGGIEGIQEIIIGMAHRGRINVLVNVLGKSPDDLFSEFEGSYSPANDDGSGDVKYHMGFSADVRTPAENVHVTLAFNPSHLEIVNPVVEGSVRARQERRGDESGDEILPVLIHGDAAFAGQGVVAETLQMSRTRGFSTGGTIHIVCNNQIGFTISDPRDARSTPYASDVAKMLEAPVFHVNGDDPEAAVLVTRMALAYRQTFNKDVVIDLVCYRRHGHNEADEPAVTQPRMYHAIKQHPTLRQLYTERLVAEGVIDATDPERMVEAYRERLEAGHPLPETAIGMIGNEFTVDWSRFENASWDTPVDTAVSESERTEIALAITRIPQEMALHPRVARIMSDRQDMAAEKIPMDWGFAEMMAYGTLLKDGYRVRLTGQDSRRGTFFHRHAALTDQGNGRDYYPLDDIDNRRGSFSVTDSLLSEEAVLGFEYGYSTTDPDTLVIWEAQFGDFCNGAQVVIDQFISSGETKWGRLSGLTLFLPHGQEGQGPEHSSARLERFLQLSAEHNQQICIPSTPAQIFHLLRRQMLRNLRTPLIIMTPKSLLRHRLASSPLSTLTDGQFEMVIPEIDDLSPEAVDRLIFCSGKVYYDLLEARRTRNARNIAIVRLEQLYPFPRAAYAQALSEYPQEPDVVWCQEEPQNQGAWYQIRHKLQEPLTKQTLSYAGRPSAAAPAAGIFQVHIREQQSLVAQALGA